MNNGIYLTLAASAVVLASCAPQHHQQYMVGIPAGMAPNAVVHEGVPCERIAQPYRAMVKGCETVVKSPGPIMTQEVLIDLNVKFRQDVEPVVTFDFDKAVLRADARAILDRQADWIKRYPNLRFSVFGHTDLVGSLDYNFDLAKRRADTTLAYLLSRGVKQDQLEAIVSFGKTQPMIETRRREERNRRTVTEVAGYLRIGGISTDAVPCSYLDPSYLPTYAQCYLTAPVLPPPPPVTPPTPPRSVEATHTSTTQSGRASISVSTDGTTTREASGITGPTQAPTTDTMARSVEGPTGNRDSVSANALGASGPVSASITANPDGTNTYSAGDLSVTY
jgi:outer membrane protein OmpA-like peptidoglycan-associated protein